MPAVGADSPVAVERFRSDNLTVREIRGFSRDRLVVTFDSYTHDRRPDRPGFGEAFFAGHSIDAVHVIPCGNDWYQYPEMPDAAALIGNIAAAYKRVVSYGSSMGGYAAIRFGEAVGASAALALSPQFSVDPAAVPFETRWRRDARHLDFSLERRWPAGFVETSYIAFDPYTPDRGHVELFAGKTGIVPIRIANSGHPCTGYLAEIGLLQQAALAVVRGDLDAGWLSREARERRKQSPQFYFALSSRARSLRCGAALARRALELAPHHILGRAHYGKLLLQLGEEAEAHRQFARVREIAPGDPAMLEAVAEAYRLAGDFHRACATFAELIEQVPVGRERFERAFKRLRRQARRKRLMFWRGGRAN